MKTTMWLISNWLFPAQVLVPWWCWPVTFFLWRVCFYPASLCALEAHPGSSTTRTLTYQHCQLEAHTYENEQIQIQLSRRAWTRCSEPDPTVTFNHYPRCSCWTTIRHRASMLRKIYQPSSAWLLFFQNRLTDSKSSPVRKNSDYISKAVQTEEDTWKWRRMKIKSRWAVWKCEFLAKII